MSNIPCDIQLIASYNHDIIKVVTESNIKQGTQIKQLLHQKLLCVDTRLWSVCLSCPVFYILNNIFSLLSFTLQEMLDIMKSIYDMMGKYTYPTMQDDTPREHVESFFQVPLNSLYFLLTPHFIV